MRLAPLLALLALLAASSGAAHGQHSHTQAAPDRHAHDQPAREAHHAAVDARGAQAMGFDQARTVHNFRLYDDGGAIEVAVKDAGNAVDRDAIRTHLPHIASRFAAGHFGLPMLVHDADVPGTADMARLKDRIRYRYGETPGGGRVDIVTTDAEALAAVHRFLRFQIADHRTGDPGSVGARP